MFLVEVLWVVQVRSNTLPAPAVVLAINKVLISETFLFAVVVLIRSRAVSFG